MEWAECEAQRRERRSDCMDGGMKVGTSYGSRAWLLVKEQDVSNGPESFGGG